jgi:predicted metal-dependent HD superfamily phosphohydrolase
MHVYHQLLQETENHVRTFFDTHMDAKYVFHDLEHTVQTVAAARVIGEGFELDEKQLALLQMATWFHDTGYAEGPTDHEERSCANATAYLSGKISEEEIQTVVNCIRATRVPQQPSNLLEEIICDADLSHLGMETYWYRTGKFRQELILTTNRVMGELEWVDFEISFLLNHSYHTLVANELFNKRKAKHIQQLLKQKRRLNPDKAPTLSELSVSDDTEKNADLHLLLKEQEREAKIARFGRGVETMYRTTYRTHTNLSQMADSKANLMLSVNAIVISILVSNLLPKLEQDNMLNMRLAIPAILLTGTCLCSMIFATLSTRPKVTEGKVTREAIKQRKANLLFFGNFHNMALEDFEWGVNEMLKDQEFLYGSMSRDLYFLGIVLAKKYLYLSICYNIFMYGLIVSVLAFAAAFVF